MLRREDFTLEAVFNTLCIFSNNPDKSIHPDITGTSLKEHINVEYVSERSLSRFFRRNGFFASKNEISALIHRLDLNYDEAITREEINKYFINASKNCK